MELIRGLHNLRPPHRGCVASIGNFDGMHRGHQGLLAQLREAARQTGLPDVALIFEPQPREYFQAATAPSRLTRLREKLELFGAAGLAQVLCLRFDERLAAMSAGQFIENVLIDGLGVRVLIVGEDFRFGSHRGGDVFMLERAATERGFALERAQTICVDGERVSSSRVRAALDAGQMDTAFRLLGRHYSMSGRVVHGDKRGRQIGYPTLNIDLHRVRAPIDGIFAARVHGLEAKPLDAMAYIGARPVVNGEHKRLEVHVFDYVADWYGRHVRVEFMRKLREDRSFDSLEALKVQMNVDASQARSALAEL